MLAAAVLVVVGTAVLLPSAVVPVLGALGLAAMAPLLRRLVDGAAWSLPVLAAVAVLLADTGGRSIAPGPERYLATFAVVLTVVLVGVRRDDRSRALRTTALVLFAYGLVGTLYGRFVLGTASGTLPLIGPLIILCLSPVRNWAPVPQWRLGLRVLSAACALFAVGSGLSRSGILPATQVDVLNHEKAFLVVLGVAAAIAAGNRLLIAFSTAALVFAFSTYPAATYVLAVAIMAGTLVLVRWAPLPGVRIMLAVATLVGTFLAVVRVGDLIALTNSYFLLVGKIDNGDTRAALYRAALDRLDSPVFSSLFTGDITVVGNLSGENRVVPVHNDYLSIALGGGLVAAALLLGLFLFANGMAIRALADLTDPWQRRTVMVLLGAVNAAAVSAFANPIFMNPGASAVTYAVLGALIAACRRPPADRAEELPATAAVHHPRDGDAAGDRALSTVGDGGKDQR